MARLHILLLGVLLALQLAGAGENERMHEVTSPDLGAWRVLACFWGWRASAPPPPPTPRLLQHTQKKAPDAAELLRLGDAAFASGEYTAAVRHYSDAIDADPATPLFYTKRAAAHISLRHQALALKVCLLMCSCVSCVDLQACNAVRPLTRTKHANKHQPGTC